jgi:hypothetical protein
MRIFIPCFAASDEIVPEPSELHDSNRSKIPCNMECEFIFGKLSKKNPDAPRTIAFAELDGVIGLEH